MNVLSHAPNVAFPSEVLSYDVQYGFFFKVAKNNLLRLILHYFGYLTLLISFVFYC